MTPDVQELQRWSLGLMGWEIGTAGILIDKNGNKVEKYPGLPGSYLHVLDWMPDEPSTGQIWVVVERMGKLGWSMQLWQRKDDSRVVFYKRFTDWRELKKRDYTKDTNPAIAILTAARRALEGGGA